MSDPTKLNLPEGLSLEELRAGLPKIVGPQDDPGAPPLPLMDDEPTAVSRHAPEEFRPDVQLLNRLHALLSPNSDPDIAMAELATALSGAPYDFAKLPDARILLVAVMRVLTERGVTAEDMLTAVGQQLR